MTITCLRPSPSPIQPMAPRSLRRSIFQSAQSPLIAMVLLPGWSSSLAGPIGFSAPVSVSIYQPTANFADNFAARGVLSGYTNFVFGNNSFYTREKGEPAHDGAFGTNSAWISWTAPDSGLCTISTTTNG